MRVANLEIVNENVPFDDKTLIKTHKRLKLEYLAKKKIFECSRKHLNENDYLSLAVARLAYEFAKEEYTLLCNEITRRGLIIQ